MTKDEGKIIDLNMKKIAKQFGYKSINGSYYKKRQEGLHILHTLVTKSGFKCRSCIKDDRNDDVLWDVLDMPDNKTYRYSLHVDGAFAAPTIFVSDYFYETVDDYEQTFIELWNLIERDLNSFMNQRSLEQIIFSMDADDSNVQLHKCLYYIDKGQINEAADLAKAEMDKGRDGGFSNEGRDLYERVIDLLNDDVPGSENNAGSTLDEK